MLRVGGRGATASRRAWLLQSDGRPHVHLHCERALAETEESFTPGGGVIKLLKLYLAFIGLCNRHGRLQRPASCAPAPLETHPLATGDAHVSHKVVLLHAWWRCDRGASWPKNSLGACD